MSKGKKGRKQPLWRKIARAAIRLFGVGIGVAVATSPLHRGIRDGLGGNTQQMVLSIQQDVGIPLGGAPDVSKLVSTGVTAGVGIGIMYLFGYLSRRV